METKLTLKLDRVAINSAKAYAKSNRKSLSKLVEGFFWNLVYENAPPVKYPELIERLSGVISADDLDRLSMEDERTRYILRESR